MTEPTYAPDANQKPLQGAILEAALVVWGKAGGQRLIPITGRSMLPLIRDGDYVLVAHGCTGVRRGDVVVFRHRSKLFAHRVLAACEGIAGATFVTKGDNVPHFDPPIGNREIIGRVISIRRGRWHMPLDTGAWRIVGWLIAVSALAVEKLRSLGGNRDREPSERRHNRLGAFLSRVARNFSLIIRKIVFMALCRWKE